MESEQPISGLTWRNGLLGFGALLALVVCFLFYSLVVTFSNWPWTKTETTVSGSVTGFGVGAPKRACFEHAIALQQRGEIRALQLLDAAPTTYEESFKGTNLTPADFEPAAASNAWHIGLTGVNAWLVLTFEDDRLVRIVRHDYRGPTE